MPIRVGNAPVSWGVDIVEWGPRPPFETFLDELKAAGYEGTELGPYGYLPTDPQTLKQHLDRRSLTLISAFLNLPLKDPSIDLEKVRTVAALLARVGAGFLVLSDTLWPERIAVAGRVQETGVGLNGEEWRNATQNLRAACKIARDHGLNPIFHHHAGTYIETPAELARIVESSDVGVCFDTGHHSYGGGDPFEGLQTFRDRISYLHWKDLNPEKLAEARAQKLSFTEGVTAGVFCPLGEGCVPFKKVLDHLQATGYDGWTVVEQDVDTRDPDVRPFEWAKASREYLRGLMDAGV